MRIIRPLFILLLSLWLLPTAFAQVTTQPTFFRETDPVTIVYDATQGNGELRDFDNDVYIWTGVIVSGPTGTTWTSVKSPSFGQPDPAAKMTRSTTNRNIYTITFTPRTFYPVPTGATIYRLAMIFKNGDGSKVGRGPDGDIFKDVAQTAISVRFNSPTSVNSNPIFVQSGTSVSVSGEASVASQLTLTLNGTQVAQVASATTLTASVPVSQAGRNELVLTAVSGGNTVSTTLVIFVRAATVTAELPTGARKDGVTYLNNGTSAIFSLTAPSKEFVYVIGDFNNWQPNTQSQLKKTSGTDAATGRWWVQVDGLTAGQEYGYQFLVDGGIRIPDPYTEKVLDPNNDRFIPSVTYPNLKAYPTGLTTGLVSVLQSNAPGYTFKVTNFARPKRTDMVVYELLVRDFLARHDYETLTDTLEYIKRLGVNVIELMPVNEFEGNESWGYNSSFYFAPDKYYGPKNELKKFVDKAHKMGIAVIMDMVLNQSFGQSPMVQLYFENGNPATNNPWFNRTATHPFNVGYDFNHESPYTRYFSKRVMEFWMKEYNMDGYRFDLSKGFTQKITTDAGAWSQYDASRVAIWKDYADFMLQEVSPTIIPMLEHLGNDDEERALSNMGLMLWGKMTDAYNEGTMGYNENGKSNLSRTYHVARGYPLAQPNVVAYMESHDEERLMFKNLAYGAVNGTYSVKNLTTALARQELAAAFFFAVPGPKMIWQFGEVGYDKSIFQCPDGSFPAPPRANDDCKLSNKPVLWNYYQEPARRRLYDVYRSLIALKTQEPAFEDPASFVQDVSGAVKVIRITDPRLSVVVVGNFDVRDASATPNFPTTGTWYNYLTGSPLTVTNVSAPLPLKAGEYAIYTSRSIAKPTGTLLPARAAQNTMALRLTAAPNPTATTATLRYELSTTAAVSVTVSNLLGATVRTLTTTGRQLIGAHELTLPVTGLANGVYLVRLLADGQQQTTRLVVQH